MGVCRENPQDPGTSLTHPPGETTLPPRCQPQAVSRKHAVLGLGTACNLTPCGLRVDRKSTRLNSSHLVISYAVFCLKKKKRTDHNATWKARCLAVFPR